MDQIKATVAISRNFSTFDKIKLRIEIVEWLAKERLRYHWVPAEYLSIGFFDIKSALFFKMVMGRWGKLAPEYDPVILPLIRRVMPSVLVNSILGVQPMTGSTGNTFAFRARYVNSDDSNDSV